MTRFLVVLCLISCIGALRAPHAQNAFELSLPENEEPRYVSGFVNMISQVVETQVSMPVAGQLFLVLVCSFVLLSLVMYALTQYKYFKGLIFKSSSPTVSDTEKGQTLNEVDEPSTFEKIFNDSTLSNARNAMVMAPVVATLISYLLFRASGQNYDMTSNNFQALEGAMAIATIGILLQALDALSIRLYSDVLGNLSESLGSLAVYFGLGAFLWALYVVRVGEIPMSTPTKLIVALTFLFIGVMLVLKFMELKKRFFDTRSPVKLEILNDVLTDNRLEEIRNAAAMAPFLMIVLFYVNFRYFQVGSLPYYINVGFTGAVVCIYVEAAGSVIKSFIPDMLGSVIRAITVIAFNIFFLIGMVALVDEDWPGPSIALTHVLLLIFVIAVINIEIALIQELSTHLLSNDDTNTKDRVASLITVSQGMQNTAGLGQVVCIMLLFLHYYADYFLKTPSVDNFIDQSYGLKEFIYFVSVAIFVQMGIQLIEAFTGPHAIFVTVVSLAVLVMNAGLAGIIYYLIA